MHTNKLARFALLALLPTSSWAMVSCQSGDPSSDPLDALPGSTETSLGSPEAAGSAEPAAARPEARSFQMGFTAFPYDLTPDAMEHNYDQIEQHADLILHHFDHGVPWDEALDGTEFPPVVADAVADAKGRLRGTHRVLLTATPTSPDRTTLANYWGVDSHQPLPGEWQERPLSDPEVIEAYLNYCRRIITEVEPDYFAYAIEINASYRQGTPAYNEFMILASEVYPTLKAEFPALPIMMTFQTISFENDHQELLDLTRDMLQYSDHVALSTYPFWHYDHPRQDADPDLLAGDWMAAFRELAPDKPFAISETGYIAEPFTYESLDVEIDGTEEWQEDYVVKLLTQANDLDAEFVAWFVLRDYDRLAEHFDPASREALNIWKDTGLFDGDGGERTGLLVWDDWLGLPVG